MVAIERVAELAAKTAEISAHSHASVDAAPPASHANDAGYQELKV
jgi:hypothetical protein